ncbi:DUF3231 family protein [Dethiobacter alkaliphilus]|uniref:Coat F domain protein n=1 Tax=Dethiobacter alkaliphilus AHT 1 TaxID=555088 RepID=C0GJX9_DETAL|nr:DUF3231 family protein [Dethiobacter alkaliphilus]EEG76348.1 conserved hypothetical protein [Dethiobacter alkaliphilus AHT 1]
MFQVGNVHIGKAETTTQPTISIIEAGILWNMLSARYKCIEETNIYFNYAHDKEFKEIISRMGMAMLNKHITDMEKQCEIFGVPMVKRPPKSTVQQGDNMNFSDQFMFRQIFEGCQHFLCVLADCIAKSVHNDALRDMYIDHYNGELEIFNNLCKYGKMKGWLEIPPIYKPN